MLDPTTPEQAAYQAGVEDHQTAIDRTQRMVERGDIFREDFEEFFRLILADLHRRRIERGELPPILQKAS